MERVSVDSGGQEVHLSKGWTSVTTTEDEAVVWEEQEYFEQLDARTPPGATKLGVYVEGREE